MVGFNKEQLAVGLYDRGAIRFSNFEWTLKNGNKSPLYYNQRGVTSVDAQHELSPVEQIDVRDLLVKGLSSAIDQVQTDYDHLYGIPQSPTSLAAMVAHERGESVLWGRVGVKEYGQHSKIEGDHYAGETVVAIDDVVTDAGTKLETARSLDEQDKQLYIGAFVLTFDREEGGRAAIESEGHSLISVLGLAETMAILRDNERIGQQEFDWVEEYHQNLGIA